MLLEFIQGRLVAKGTNYVVVQTGGLGCRIFVPAFTWESLPPLREEIALYTYLHIREDDLSLFGFFSSEEKEFFVMLMSVSGIGPKLALAILSRLRVPELKRAILVGDAAVFSAIPGVGKKTAERIILELKDKVGKQEMLEYAGPGTAQSFAEAREEAVAALLALGYTLPEAQKAVPFPDPSSGKQSVEELLRIAFKSLAKY
ncbi:MAG: Holliday junction branch migration protein RuvA [Peptococcaceae bacterium]|jgi:Holliday junction DNA helicase RuvA|nr:Holliday junction branch migration protein RuvA [Peptococcaceae bacterium]MDH7525115.1 Holliday junction branch migration protein RuvA [Peptococcaceae bacterium]